MDSSANSNEKGHYIDSDSVRNKLKLLEQDNLALREELQHVESFVSTIKKELSKSSWTIEKQKKMCEELQQENDKQKVNIINFEGKVAEYKNMLVENRRVRKELENKINFLETENEKLINMSGQVEQLSKSNNLMEIEISKCRDEYERKCLECEALQRDISSLEDWKTKLENSLTETISIYTKNNENCRSTLLNLQMEYEEIEMKYGEENVHNLSLSSNNDCLINSTPLKGSNGCLNKSLYEELKDAGTPISCCNDDSKQFNHESKYVLLVNDLYNTANALNNVAQILDKSENEYTSSEINKLKDTVNHISDLAKSISEAEQIKQLNDFNENHSEESRFILSSDSSFNTPLRPSLLEPSDEYKMSNEIISNSSLSSLSSKVTSSRSSSENENIIPRRKISVYDNTYDVRDHQVFKRESPNTRWSKYRSSVTNDSDSSENTSPMKASFDANTSEPNIDESDEVPETPNNNNNVFLAPTKFKVPGLCSDIINRTVPPINLHLNLSDKRNKDDRFRNVTFRKYKDDPRLLSDLPTDISCRLSFGLSSISMNNSSSSSETQSTNDDIPKIEVTNNPPTCFADHKTESEKASITKAAVPRAMSNGECDNSNAFSVKTTFSINEFKMGTSPETGSRRDRYMNPLAMRRSASENDVKKNIFKKIENMTSEKSEKEVVSFPSLTDIRLQMAGIASLSDLNSETMDIMENELERKYTSFSIGLAADRMTLSRRSALALRQRNQAESNLSAEIQRMKQDIQDLTSFCINKDSIEKIEKARHQLEMIDKCAHNMSCSAETLGAIKQESRISRAISLADRYLQVLRTRCEKLSTEVTETKRILNESNVVLEENSNEIGDDVPRIRYRAVNSNSRAMIARRRASIATMSRPMTTTQDTAKDYNPKQRNSICGRVSSRRPSLSYERQSTDSDRLDRTESPTSVNEAREIIDMIHVKHNSREENNSLQRQCSTNNGDGPLCMKENNISELPIVQEINMDSEINNQIMCQPSFWIRRRRLKNVIIIVIILMILLILYKWLTSINFCDDKPCEWWSIEEIFNSYIEFANIGPKAI